MQRFNFGAVIIIWTPILIPGIRDTKIIEKQFLGVQIRFRPEKYFNENVFRQLWRYTDNTNL